MLLWWLIPIGITVLAVGWAAYRGRPRKPAEGHAGMASLRRFQDAMERPLPNLDESADPSPETGRRDVEPS